MALKETAAPVAFDSQRRARLRKTYAYYLAFIILGLVAASIGPTLPRLAEHTHSSIGQISYLFVLRSLGYLIGSLIAGRLYDRAPGHPIMTGVIGILALAMFFIPLSQVLWLLALLLLSLGVAQGMLDVGGNTLLAWVHPDKIGPFMNGLHFFFGLGAFLSPVIIAVAVQGTGGIYWAFWSLALLMLPSALWLGRLPSPSPIAASQTAPVRPALPVLITLIAVFNFLYVGSEVAFGGWVFTYAATLNLGTTASAALLTSGFWGAMTAGRLLAIPLAARFQPGVILLAALLALIASLALIIALPGSYIALWAGAIGVGLGMAAIFPTLLTLAGRYMALSGFVTSWFFVGSSLGGMTLPWIIGQLFEPVGPRVVMLIITASSGLAFLIFGAMMVYIRRIAR